MRCWTAAICLAMLSQVAWCNTYMVTNTNSSGTGSLPWAIQEANAHVGADTITFAPGLVLETLQPINLPALTDANTTIDGDLNDDGLPDITVDGNSGGLGFEVRANNCELRGLAVIRYSTAAIWIEDCTGCKVRNCHLGANTAGTQALRNGYADIWIKGGGSHVIGGTGGRNLFTCGANGTLPAVSAGVQIWDSSNNQVRDNYFGLDVTGQVVLGGVGGGIFIEKDAATADNNIIRNNVFAGSWLGIDIVGGNQNTVQGNLFGLGANGDTALAMSTGVRIKAGARNNLIGGQTVNARNVFGAVENGVEIDEAGTQGNRVQGNYFGTNKAGTAQRPMRLGIEIGPSAGSQTIGGNVAAAGNVICTKKGGLETGIYLIGGGNGTVIRYNQIGVLPSGSNAQTYWTGVYVRGATATVTDNLIARGYYGLQAEGSSATAHIFRNTFRTCEIAVYITDGAKCYLGNLHNVKTTDDGGNDFAKSNTWAIKNYTPLNVRAEGNEFHTTVKAEIEAKIYDKKDDPTLGRVDFIPLAGGIIPTGETEGVLAVAGLTAVPTSGGAEIAFSLSAPARVTVTILNLAGRPVATVAADRPAEAGLQRVAWNGYTNTGVAAPPGRYLVRIIANGEAGTQATALTSMTVR